MSKQDVNSIRLTLPPQEPPTYFSSGNKIGVFKLLRRAAGCRIIQPPGNAARQAERLAGLPLRAQERKCCAAFFCRPASVLTLKLTRGSWPPSIFFCHPAAFCCLSSWQPAKEKVRQKPLPDKPYLSLQPDFDPVKSEAAVSLAGSPFIVV